MKYIYIFVNQELYWLNTPLCPKKPIVLRSVAIFFFFDFRRTFEVIVISAVKFFVARLQWLKYWRINYTSRFEIYVRSVYIKIQMHFHIKEKNLPCCDVIVFLNTQNGEWLVSLPFLSSKTMCLTRLFKSSSAYQKAKLCLLNHLTKKQSQTYQEKPKHSISLVRMFRKKSENDFMMHLMFTSKGNHVLFGSISFWKWLPKILLANQ